MYIVEYSDTFMQCGPLDIEIISEEFIVMLRQLSYAIKNQDKWLHALKESIIGRPIIDSFSDPYAIKNQRKARKPLVGGFGCLELVLYGIRELA